MGQSSFSPEAAFWDKVPIRRPGECWEWQGARRPPGHGQLRRAGRLLYAHRVSYEAANGPIPAGLVVRHTCDNPPCVNPAHLVVGTYQDNTDDSIVRCRLPRGVARSQVKLSDDAVRSIRVSGARHKALAEAYGVSKQLISAVRRGKAWAHVTS